MTKRKNRQNRRGSQKGTQGTKTETGEEASVVETRDTHSAQLEERVNDSDLGDSPFGISHGYGSETVQKPYDDNKKGSVRDYLTKGLGIVGFTGGCLTVVGLVGFLLYSVATGGPKDGERLETPVTLSTTQLGGENVSCIYSLTNRDNMFIQAQLESDSGKRAWIHYPWCGGAVQADKSTLVGYTHPAGNSDLEEAKKLLTACIGASPLPVPKYRACPRP